MNKYELLYIIASDVTEEAREALIAKFKAFVESKNGTVDTLDKWGIKKFAYPINFRNDGFYVLMNFNANPEIISEMNNLMTITDGIVRQMFVRKDK